MIEFIVHDEPVGRAQSNYIAMANLAPFGLDGSSHIWGRPNLYPKRVDSNETRTVAQRADEAVYYYLMMSP